MLFRQVLFFITILLFTLIVPSSLGTDSSIEMKKYTLKCDTTPTYKNIDYFDISYHITNATISDIKTDKAEDLLVYIQNSTGGTLTISIPQSLMYSPLGNPQTNYPVLLADGNQLRYDKIVTTSSDWIIDFKLPVGVSLLQFIIGGTPEDVAQYSRPCSVVPEFDSFVILSITISIIGLIIIQKRFMR